ncbi:uncharacterized protein [Halyomorpha halys]|uniref:uncharacterized protein isoform X2 n=1 Tax=Halyomorpha halys TaxID=286706 RepID=UPI0006D4CD8E|nr:uncharacterized protein LOC106685967 isoform X2 [Halyomorpha halys]
MPIHNMKTEIYELIEKGEIGITKKTIPDHYIFYGLPKNENACYTRHKYIKPLAQYLTIKYGDNFGLNDALIKMSTPDPENTFERELEKAVIKIEKMFDEQIQEVEKVMNEAGIEYSSHQQASTSISSPEFWERLFFSRVSVQS